MLARLSPVRAIFLSRSLLLPVSAVSAAEKNAEKKIKRTRIRARIPDGISRFSKVTLPFRMMIPLIIEKVGSKVKSGACRHQPKAWVKRPSLRASTVAASPRG